MMLGNLTKRGCSLLGQLKSGSAQNFPSPPLHPDATAAGWLLRFESSLPASAPSAVQQQQYASPSKSGLLVDTLEMVRRDAIWSYTMMWMLDCLLGSTRNSNRFFLSLCRCVNLKVLV
jgi:hypothetical protein